MIRIEGWNWKINSKSSQCLKSDLSYFILLYYRNYNERTKKKTYTNIIRWKGLLNVGKGQKKIGGEMGVVVKSNEKAAKRKGASTLCLFFFSELC